jgi:hypothetical protein
VSGGAGKKMVQIRKELQIKAQECKWDNGADKKIIVNQARIAN